MQIPQEHLFSYAQQRPLSTQEDTTPNEIHTSKTGVWTTSSSVTVKIKSHLQKYKIN